MKKRLFVHLLFLLAVSVFMASEVLAQCPEGKNPVQLTTPSGNTKTLCIPDSAVQGIENAAEHSGGTIVTATCPCWDENELSALKANYDMYCYDYYGNQKNCDGYDYKNYVIRLLATDKTEYGMACANYSRIDGTLKVDVSQEELDACNASLQPYFK